MMQYKEVFGFGVVEALYLTNVEAASGWTLHSLANTPGGCYAILQKDDGSQYEQVIDLQSYHDYDDREQTR